MEIIGGRYRITGYIARGGMGRVVRATHLELRHTVALKLFDPLHAKLDPLAMQRFIMEGRILAACRHPNVVEVYDAGRAENGVPFLVMELLDGATLSSLLERRGALPPAVVARIGIGVASALAKLHALGFVHRDIKAGNVMWVRNGHAPTVKVIDFGLVKSLGDRSRFTQPGMIVGSPSAMSPEQIAGEPLDVSSDVYGLGTLLYQLATGRHVFEGNAPGVLRAHLSKRPESPPCHPVLGAIIERCIAKSPSDRFQNMGPLISALEAAQAKTRRVPPPPPRPRRSSSLCAAETVPLERVA